MQLLPFILATASLLAIPGPTNTLLATSGAAIGVSRSLPLLAAELAGYLTAILVLRFVLGPLVIGVPLAGLLLRVAVTVYVLYLALLLWRYRARDVGEATTVTFKAVLITTLFNPKAAVFAFLLLPAEAGGLAVLPWIAMVALQIVVAGTAWLMLGTMLGRGLRSVGYPELLYRLSAIVLVVMMTAINAGAFAAS
jgi:threonine/homoserine/homoserine lactone efflux protein